MSAFFLQVNCAGILELGSIETTSLEQYDRMFNINVRYALGFIVKTVGATTSLKRLTAFSDHDLFLVLKPMSPVTSKPVYVICEQQGRRSACPSAQSDQFLCYSVPR